MTGRQLEGPFMCSLLRALGPEGCERLHKFRMSTRVGGEVGLRSRNMVQHAYTAEWFLCDDRPTGRQGTHAVCPYAVVTRQVVTARGCIVYLRVWRL